MFVELNTLAHVHGRGTDIDGYKMKKIFVRADTIFEVVPIDPADKSPIRTIVFLPERSYQLAETAEEIISSIEQALLKRPSELRPPSKGRTPIP